MSEQNSLLMPFIDDSESFTNGFECGQIWEMLKNGESITGKYVHSINRGQIEMICNFYKVDYVIVETPITDEWVELTVVHDKDYIRN